MIAFPCAKVNLGLNIVERRADGYHNLETVFYPVPICDALEVNPMDARFPLLTDCDLAVSNLPIEGDVQQNLVAKAYHLLQRDFPSMPRVHAHLHKVIPTQAGMGGGSSDCSAMLMVLNELCELHLDAAALIDYAARLGADCPFFILNKPAYAEGIGERLEPVDLDLSGLWMAAVKPPVAVSTREAFARVVPRRPAVNCRQVVMRPVEEWRGLLVNDFEQSVFAQYPAVQAVKDRLYQLGAAYAAMSGSGSAVFGLFRQEPVLGDAFGGMFTKVMPL